MFARTLARQRQQSDLSNVNTAVAEELESFYAPLGLHGAVHSRSRSSTSLDRD